MQIAHGDCLELMNALPARSIDAIIADLPYGMTANKWDTVIDLGRFWAACWRVAKPGAPVVLTAAQPFTCRLGASCLDRLRYSWVWEKEPSGNLNAKRQPMQAHEDVLVFGAGPITYNPQGLKPTLRKRGARDNSRTQNYGAQKAEPYTQTVTGYPSTIISVAKDREGLHPTQKPVELFRYLVRTYTNPGDTVLDCTMGSGTTGVACMREGRRFVGFELDAAYFATAADRLAKAAKEIIEW